MPKPELPSARRVTLRQIAEAAGVTPMTVSLSLRNHPSISERRRKQVQRLAERLGYTPDPMVAKLMQHLRGHRVSRLQASICALTTFPGAARDPFAAPVLQGAAQMACSLGYGFEVVHVDESYVAAPTRLRRLLRNRNVDGLLLLPLVSPKALDDLVRWDEFSVIATTLSVLSPRFHCVLPSHLHNTLTLCRHLRELGRQRLGLVVREAQDRRVGFNFTAAFCWHNTFGGQTPVPPLVTEQLPDRRTVPWARQHQLDALVAETEEYAGLLEQELAAHDLAEIPVFTCSNRPDPHGLFQASGMHENPARIGGAAVELLARMIMSGEKGVPLHPRITLIEGSWVERSSPGAFTRPTTPRPRRGAPRVARP